MIDFNVVVDKINSLESADEIADLFRQYGVQAQTGVGDSCAISVFVKNLTGIEDIFTATNKIYRNPVRNPHSIDFQASEDYEYLSVAACEFVKRYDDHYYPELVEEGNEEEWLI